MNFQKVLILSVLSSVLLLQSCLVTESSEPIEIAGNSSQGTSSSSEIVLLSSSTIPESSSSSETQNLYDLSGVVVDAQSGAPLANAIVIVSGPIYRSTTTWTANDLLIPVPCGATEETNSAKVMAKAAQVSCMVAPEIVDTLITDEAGSFALSLVSTGTYWVDVTKNDYSAAVVNVSVGELGNDSVFVEMESMLDLDTNWVACPMIYAPVCGSNGRTYGNSCEADAANVSYTDGECLE